MPYDLFISYSRRDDAEGRVTELKECIAADYRAFAEEDLTCFFDLDDIHGMDDWRHRILDGLRQSNLLLLVLSPADLDSKAALAIQSACAYDDVDPGGPLAARLRRAHPARRRDS